MAKKYAECIHKDIHRIKICQKTYSWERKRFEFSAEYGGEIFKTKRVMKTSKDGVLFWAKSQRIHSLYKMRKKRGEDTLKNSFQAPKDYF